MEKDRRKAMIEMLVCSVLWSTGGILMKLIKWNAFAIAGVRSLFSALTVFVYMKAAKQKIRLTKKTALGAAFMCVAFLSFVLANKLTTAANAIVIQFTLPVFIMLFSVVFFRQKFGKRDVLAVLFTFAGIALFFFDKLNAGRMTGNFLAILAGMCLAGMYLTMDRTPAEDRVSVTLFGHLFTALIGSGFILSTETEITAISVVYIVILGIFQLGIPYILYAHATKSCPPLACALLSAIEPILNPLWVLIFDGEVPGFYALIGAVLVILTVTLWCLPKKGDIK